ncbi:thioredoxin family protein [Thioalkalivibrio sp. XN279]|uniref:thioredoxin family protein n=1 Tax=Thioalkalivibrio sp. XN279 TaxID=2714953 RepID=UPI00140D2F09|nr:thioredoxin family protein [Thioalkalivibrio sp. XN279]NHA16112.1 thioredoxin family protein [Thioalkalivibrio sp. XN279]
MARTETPAAALGATAPDFRLPGPGGREWTLAHCRGARGTLVMFICNHCPFVQAALERIVRDCRELEPLGVKSVAIMPNDITAYPQDGPEAMARLAREAGFTFPYLLDETQAVARAYGAVCTPDFFGYDADLKLRYRGRLDGSTPGRAAQDAPRELFEAMRQVAETGLGPERQLSSVGCSIKWRD